VGKTWGEGLNWSVRQAGDDMQLVMRTSHYAGNTWVDDGTSEPDWGVDYYDPQSETNPTTAGTRTVPVATITLPASTGLTKDTWATCDHTVMVAVSGLTVTTTVNGVEVDSRTLTGDQIRRHGSFGFAGGTRRSSPRGWPCPAGWAGIPRQGSDRWLPGGRTPGHWWANRRPPVKGGLADIAPKTAASLLTVLMPTPTCLNSTFVQAEAHDHRIAPWWRTAPSLWGAVRGECSTGHVIRGRPGRGLERGSRIEGDRARR